MILPSLWRWRLGRCWTGRGISLFLVCLRFSKSLCVSECFQQNRRQHRLLSIQTESMFHLKPSRWHRVEGRIGEWTQGLSLQSNKNMLVRLWMDWKVLKLSGILWTGTRMELVRSWEDRAPKSAISFSEYRQFPCSFL